MKRYERRKEIGQRRGGKVRDEREKNDWNKEKRKGEEKHGEETN